MGVYLIHQYKIQNPKIQKKILRDRVLFFYIEFAVSQQRMYEMIWNF